MMEETRGVVLICFLPFFSSFLFLISLLFFHFVFLLLHILSSYSHLGSDEEGVEEDGGREGEEEEEDAEERTEVDANLSLSM